MKIELFEPPMCCSSGVCGPSVDPKLVELQETLRLIGDRSGGAVEVNRYNLSSDLDAFAKNDAISEELKQWGPDVLPVIYIDGERIGQRKYPTRDEWQQALAQRGVAIYFSASPGDIVSSDSSGCGPGCCG